MFTKQNIIKQTKILLYLLVFHFVGITFIKFQIGHDLNIEFLKSNLINVWKDIYLVFIYFLIGIYARKNKKEIKINKKLWFFFFIVICISVGVSLIHFQGVKTLVLGFKYDLWFLFPLVFYSLLSLDKKEISKFYDLFLEIIKVTLTLCVLFMLIRFTYPNFLYLLGYGQIGDWAVGEHPPLLFQTGLNGIQRLSGIFSGPNHMAFYLIAFGPILLLSIINKKSHWIWGILFILLLFGTLSRSGILAFFVEIGILGILTFIYQKRYRKVITICFTGLFSICVFLGVYLFVSGKYNEIILRGASTEGHIERSGDTIKHIIQNPIAGHGIGTAGPSAHYIESDIIPESWFLQIFYEIGILGGFIWFAFIFYSLLTIYNKKKIIKERELDKVNILIIGSIIGIIGLFVQGLVLHSFEDSMIIIPLFILLGILINHNLEIKKINDRKNKESTMIGIYNKKNYSISIADNNNFFYERFCNVIFSNFLVCIFNILLCKENISKD